MENIKQGLKCPICGNEMGIRIQNREHVNASSKKVTKHKYYQYFCSIHDDLDTGYTTTESDEKSLNL